MNINNELEQKLISSNNHIDSVLNSSVNIKFICKINDRYLLNKETMSLPSIKVAKGLLNNNYDERYYIINIDINDLININSKYIYDGLSAITDKREYNILIESNI